MQNKNEKNDSTTKSHFISRYILSFLFFAFFLSCKQVKNKAAVKTAHLPNVIYILADDLGYGDLSCYNEDSKIVTPNIDRLAAGGMKFMDAHSGSSVCTPTRYGILTGRYAWRTYLEKGVTWSYDRHLIHPDRMTVADLFQEQGYRTACIGKWHLGLDFGMDSKTGTVDFFKPINYGPLEYGFDYFFGIAASLDIPPYLYIENDRITATRIDTIPASSGKAFWREGPIGDDFEMEQVLPTFTQKAVKYIESAAEKETPFFLYFPLPAPHTPVIPTESFKNESQLNEYGDFVLMVDDLVGQITAALEASGQAENTMIVFTSDNGFAPIAGWQEVMDLGHYPSRELRGHKADIYEGGHRMPFIVQWKDRIIEGRQSDKTICLTDFMATCGSILGVDLPDEVAEDSYDLSPLLFAENRDTFLRTNTVHHSVNGSFAIRAGKWKLNFCPGSGGWSKPRPAAAKKQGLPSVQLYNLEKDIAEQNNIADVQPEVVTRLTELMQTLIDNGRSTQGAVQENDRMVEFLMQ
ncbi:MAG: arylsulfatase [Bacteroidota bacterium]